jgi:hypothetical protein
MKYSLHVSANSRKTSFDSVCFARKNEKKTTQVIAYTTSFLEYVNMSESSPTATARGLGGGATPPLQAKMFTSMGCYEWCGNTDSSGSGYYLTTREKDRHGRLQRQQMLHLEVTMSLELRLKASIITAYTDYGGMAQYSHQLAGLTYRMFFPLDSNKKNPISRLKIVCEKLQAPTNPRLFLRYTRIPLAETTVEVPSLPKLASDAICAICLENFVVAKTDSSEKAKTDDDLDIAKTDSSENAKTGDDAKSKIDLDIAKTDTSEKAKTDDDAKSKIDLHSAKRDDTETKIEFDRVDYTPNDDIHITLCGHAFHTKCFHGYGETSYSASASQFCKQNCSHGRKIVNVPCPTCRTLQWGTTRVL